MIYKLFFIFLFYRVTVGQGPGGGPNGRVGAPGCPKKKDIIFLLDMSSSIGASNFQIMLEKCKDIVDDHTVGTSATLFGLAVFSTRSKLVIKLNDHTNKEDLKNAIDEVEYEGGLTNTYLALNDLIFKGFRPSNGHRPGARKIAILMTDGNSQQKIKTINAARHAKRSGIELIVIGIGNNIDWEEILAIASGKQSSGSAFRVPSFAALRGFQPRRLLPLRKC